LFDVDSALASLYSRGCRLDWSALFPQRRPHTTLPSYPWQGERFSANGKPPTITNARRSDVSRLQFAGTMLGRHIEFASCAGTHAFENEMNLDSLPWVADHRVGSAVVFPSVGFMLMALDAASKVHGSRRVSLGDVSICEALFFNLGESRA